MPEMNLSCDCGALKGKATIAKPSIGNRLLCYCKDCRAFAEHLGKGNKVLDQWGGSEVYQLPINSVEFEEGRDNISCLRFGEKGLYRWYAKCCDTPIGNTLGANMPFIGLISSIYCQDTSKDAVLGEVLGAVHVNSATSRLPMDDKQKQTPFWLFPRIIAKLLMWKLTGKANPNPLFTNGKPKCQPAIVSCPTRLP